MRSGSGFNPGCAFSCHNTVSTPHHTAKTRQFSPVVFPVPAVSLTRPMATATGSISSFTAVPSGNLGTTAGFDKSDIAEGS